MTGSKTDALDAFLLEALDSSADDLEADSLVGQLPALAAPSGLRERILAAATPADRLARFAPSIARLLELELPAARALLLRIDEPSVWLNIYPGIDFLPAPGGPSVRAALRGFVRVRAGVEFPEHEHLGEETVMIMQGYYADGATGAVFGPGDSPKHAERSQHSFRVLADGPDLLGLVVAQGGVRTQQQEFLPL